MTTTNAKATVYLQSSNREGLIQFAKQRGIPLKTDKQGNPIVGSSIINQALAEFLGTAPNTVQNTVPPSESTVPTERIERLEVLDGIQQRLEKLEGDRAQITNPEPDQSAVDEAIAAKERIQELEQQVTELRQQAEARSREKEMPNAAEESIPAGTDSFDSPEGRTQSYEALFLEIEGALLSELKQGKQSAIAKKIHKVMGQFRKQYP